MKLLFYSILPFFHVPQKLFCYWIKSIIKYLIVVESYKINFFVPFRLIQTFIDKTFFSSPRTNKKKRKMQSHNFVCARENLSINFSDNKAFIFSRKSFSFFLLKRKIKWNINYRKFTIVKRGDSFFLNFLCFHIFPFLHN